MRKLILFCSLFALASAPHAKAEKAEWWDKQYTTRQAITIDTGKEGVELDKATGEMTVLVRLHEGNFQFLSALEDGSDIRFLADDHKTLLPFHLEKYDSLLNEGFAWVKVPEIPAGEKLQFWLYYGSVTPGEGGNDPAKSFPENTRLVYHFTERNAPPSDSTSHANNATSATLLVEGSLIGSGARFDGRTAVVVPAGENLAWEAGRDLGVSVWVKSAAIEGRRTVLFAGESPGVFELGIEQGIPYVEINAEGLPQRMDAAEAIAPEVWVHLAVSSTGGETILYVNGLQAGSLSAGLPALTTQLVIGAEAATDAVAGLSGEMDELQISFGAFSAAEVRFLSANQGSSADAAKLLVVGEVATEGGGAHGGEALEHVMLFGDIAKNMMFDGWIAVGVCVIMIFFGWTVAVQKYSYLNSIQKGSDAFIKMWQSVSNDLTVLDERDDKGERTFGGHLDSKTRRQVKLSPLYHLYHIGSQEISHRIKDDPTKGLSARSIQAIRASLETGLVRENQRMNKGLIYLTISIAGGPYVGLLGTVVGVMITFALIAKTGEVEVNSIAPGIASALLATVAGLVVAIPALFIYSYLSSRIKDLLASMQVFIDEFIAKMAEFYPTPGEAAQTAPPPSQAVQALTANSKQDEPKPFTGDIPLPHPEPAP